MTKLPVEGDLPPIEPVDLSEITSEPVRVRRDDHLSQSAKTVKSKRKRKPSAKVTAASPWDKECQPSAECTENARAGKNASEPGAVHEAAATQAAATAREQATARETANTDTEAPRRHKSHSDTIYTEVIEEPDTGEVIIRKRKRRRSAAGRTSQKRRRRLLTVGAAVVLAVTACFALVAIGGYSLRHGGLTAGELFGKAPVVTYDGGRTVEYKGSTYAYKENMVSILFIGYDERVDSDRPVQGDVLIMLAIDTDTGKVTGISIPRDSMVEVDAVIGDVFTGVDMMQICLAFSYADDIKTGCEYTSRAVSRVMYNIPVSAYYAINMRGLIALNDAIGGVALTPLATIESAGAREGVPTVLQGSQALSYVQSRGDELDASLKRQQRQIQYVKAFAAQALEAAKGDASVLLDLYGIAGEYSTTDLSVGEFGYLATQVLAHGITSVNMTSLSGTMEQGDVYAEFYLDYDNVLQTILDTYYVKLDADAGTGTNANAAAGSGASSVHAA